MRANTSFDSHASPSPILIEWEDELWGMGSLWLGPRCGPDRYGQCKTNRLRPAHARRVRAPGTLNWRAVVNAVKMGYLGVQDSQI